MAHFYNLVATQTGTYTLLVQDGTGNRTEVGDYEIHFAKSLGANENGQLVNAGSVTGDISLGDLDTWTFEATEGERLNIHAVDLERTDLFMYMTLYAPDGTYVNKAGYYTVAHFYNLVATQTGTYTLLVQDGTGNRTEVGDYEIHFAKSLGANENGQLVNAGSVTGDISLGDLDTWTFEATEGERLNIHAVDLERTDLYMHMTLYAPDGTYVNKAGYYTVAHFYNLLATQTGTYTLLVQDGSGNRTGIADYEIHFAKSLDANEHGQIHGEGTYNETITLGDLDTFTFEGVVGDEITLVARETQESDMYIYMTLYNPDGSYFVKTGGSTEAVFNDLSLTQLGIYTVLIQDGGGTRAQTANYILEYNLPEDAPDPQRPIANASTSPSIFINQSIELDGSGSFDPDEGPSSLSYNWVLLSVPGDSTITQADLVNPNSEVASVQPDTYGEYSFELEVGDGLFVDSAIATVTVLNRAPIANAGEEQNVELYSSVQLDGSASTDPDGDLINFSWSIGSVPENSMLVELTNATTVHPSFSPDVAGDYIFSLVVSDEQESSIADSVLITAVETNVAPQGVIQVSGEMLPNTEVLLDGNASLDSDNGPQPLTYQWQVLNVPDGSLLTSGDLLNPATPSTSFTADISGNYTVQLTVSDGDATDVVSTTFTINNVVVNQPPIADAGDDVSLEIGSTVDVDASTSFDPDESPEPITFLWTFVSVPSGSDLNNTNIESPTNVNASFIPDVAGSYTLSVLVFDGELSDSDAVVISISENQSPVAHAGNNVTVDLGNPVSLDGSQSYDPDSSPLPLTYLWEVISRPLDSIATIENANDALATIAPDMTGLYTVRLHVDDGQASDYSDISIEVIAQIEPRMCDVDRNDHVDALDIRAIARRRNEQVDEDDPADWDKNGVINVLDARGCSLECDLTRCAVNPEL